MSSSTSFLVIRLSDASSGCGPQHARGPEKRLGPLDHLLVDRTLGQTYGIGDPLGSRIAVRDHDRLAHAEQDRAAGRIRVDLLAQYGDLAADQHATDR